MKTATSTTYTTISKVSITIDSETLFRNFHASLVDIAIDNGADGIVEAIDQYSRNIQTLLANPIDPSELRALFRDGYTPMLLGDNMESFDGNVHREIIVVQGDKTITIPHEYIAF